MSVIEFWVCGALYYYVTLLSVRNHASALVQLESVMFHDISHVLNLVPGVGKTESPNYDIVTLDAAVSY